MEYNPYSVGKEIDSATTGLQGPKFEASVRTMQIIAAALMMGVLMFLGVVLVTTAGRIDGQPEMITIIAAGFAFLMLVNHFVIPSIMVKAQLKQAVGSGIRSCR